MEFQINANRILVGNPKERIHLENLGAMEALNRF
jgi:hypothetical protein